MIAPATGPSAKSSKTGVPLSAALCQPKDCGSKSNQAATRIRVGMIWRQRQHLSITVVILCWHICLISESMGHHDLEIMDDRSID